MSRPGLGAGAMRRRDFIKLSSSAVATWPFGARAQQWQRTRRISVLSPAAGDDAERRARAAALRQGLKKLGWTEGSNINIDYRWFEGDAARAKANAEELVNQKPDVIIAASTLALTAIR